MKRALVPTALFAIAGAAAVVAVPPLVRAGEDAPREAVEKLMPDLLSDDDAVRGDAETRLFALGDTARRELERVSRESDPRRAITAVRLLGSDRWSKSAGRPGERRAERERPDADEDPSVRIDDLNARMERRFEELRKRIERFGDGFDVRIPQFRAFTVPGGPGGVLRGESSGSVVEDDRKLSWSVDEEGRVKVTVKDGADAPETTYEAKSLDELRVAHPDVAARVERYLSGPNVLRWSFDDRSPLDLRDRLRSFALPGFSGADRASMLGVEWSPVPDVLREQMEIGVGGMVVEGVVTSSLAEKLGIKRHDILVELQGDTVKDSADVKAALRKLKRGDAVTAVVIRKGQKTTLEATR